MGWKEGPIVRSVTSIFSEDRIVPKEELLKWCMHVSICVGLV